jgi:beta-lactamase class A
MSIQPINSMSSPTPIGATPRTSSSTRPAQAAGVRETGDAVTVDAIPASPPAEVLDAMTTAAQAADRLQSSGRALRFSVDPPTGRVSAQLTDLDGNPLSDVSPSTVLAVASGESLP